VEDDMSTEFDRTQGIGASDARLIMSGDWHQLWREKTKRQPPADLSKIFRVRLGQITEEFHIQWVGEKRELQIATGGDWVRQHHPTHPFIYATLDGWDFTNDTHLEAKHSHSNASLRESADYYMPQLQHQLAVTGSDWCWFSVIPGNDEPMTTQIQRHEDYIEKLIDLEKTFWWHVTQDIEPELLPTAKINAAAEHVSEILVGGYKSDLDMSRDNRWPALCDEYRTLKPQAERFYEVCQELKALIPEDRRRCFGAGVQIVRDKRNRLTVKEHDSL